MVWFRIMDYYATIIEVAPGERGVNTVNETLQRWATAGWSLHSQSITIDSRIDRIVAMVVFERQSSASE